MQRLCNSVKSLSHLQKVKKYIIQFTIFQLTRVQGGADIFFDIILDFFTVNNQHVQLAIHAIEDELNTQSK